MLGFPALLSATASRKLARVPSCSLAWCRYWPTMYNTVPKLRQPRASFAFQNSLRRAFLSLSNIPSSMMQFVHLPNAPLWRRLLLLEEVVLFLRLSGVTLFIDSLLIGLEIAVSEIGSWEEINFYWHYYEPFWFWVSWRLTNIDCNVIRY